MNTEELQQLVARARAVEGGPSRPPAGLLEEASRARRRHHRSVLGRIVAGSALACVVAAVVVPDWRAPDQSVPSSRASDPPSADELQVTCTDAGPEVSATTVAARPDGVRLVVDSTLQRGSYLTYLSSGGPSGGDRLPRKPASTVYAFPPGPVQLGCATPPSMDEVGTVTVRVVDPHGYWRPATLADQGCVRGTAPSWVMGLAASGKTAAEAVDRVLANFVAVTGKHYTAAPASIGYVDAEAQTWIAADDGGPALTLRVTRGTSGFDAGPDILCD